MTKQKPKEKPRTLPKPSGPPPMCPITGQEDFSGYGDLVVLKNGDAK